MTIANRLIAFLLLLGIFPSLTMLSASTLEAFPAVARWIGPWNPIKMGLPLLVAFVAGRIRRLPESERSARLPMLWAWAAIWCVGTLCTLISGALAGFPPAFIREWAAISAGMLGVAAWALLEPRAARSVLIGWLAVLGALVATDLIWPRATDWLYAHIFDPATRDGDLGEIGRRVLTGVWGRQSLSKLMAWVPWLVLPLVTRKARPVALIAVAGWIGLILATSQRGPALAGILAIGAFGAHQLWYRRSLKLAGAFAALVLLAVASLWAFAPPEILRSRLEAMLSPGAPPAWTSPMTREDRTLTAEQQIDNLTRAAYDNTAFRTRMWKLSVDLIAQHPLGLATIPFETFTAYQVFPAHSHSLWLEQFRSRGWIWGALHLALWIVAGWTFWQLPGWTGSSFFAGWVAVVLSGLTDHPWFVINHALVLALYLWLGLELYINDRLSRRLGEIKLPTRF